MSNDIPAQDDRPPPKIEDPRREDSYFEKLIRYIPLDIIAAYQAIDGIIRDQGSNPIWLYWAAFGCILVLTPLYTIYRPNQPPSLLHPKTRFCAFVSTVSFTVWVFALGGPFEVTFPDLYRPVYGSVLLILTVMTLPVLEKIVLGTSTIPGIGGKKSGESKNDGKDKGKDKDKGTDSK
jgi:hypothetical protein